MKNIIKTAFAILLTVALCAALFGACDAGTGKQTTDAATTTSTTSATTAATTAATVTTATTAAVTTSVPTPLSTTQTSTAVSAASSGTTISGTTTKKAPDYAKLFRKHGIQPTEKRREWAEFFVDNFPAHECDVRFADIGDGIGDEMLVTHYSRDEEGTLTVWLYVCGKNADGECESIWANKVGCDLPEDVRGAYLVEREGNRELMLYTDVFHRGEGTRRFDTFRFEVGGTLIGMSAEAVLYRDNGTETDATAFNERWDELMKTAEVLYNCATPWHEACYGEESLPEDVFAGREPAREGLNREETTFFAITGYGIDEKTGSISLLGNRLYYEGEKNAQGGYVYREGAPLTVKCKGDLPVTYRTERGQTSTAKLSEFLNGELSAYGTVLWNGQGPAYYVMTQRGEVVGLIEP